MVEALRRQGRAEELIICELPIEIGPVSRWRGRLSTLLIATPVAEVAGSCELCYFSRTNGRITRVPYRPETAARHLDMRTETGGIGGYAMDRTTFLKTHRAWEDWAVLLLGALVILSPAVDPTWVTPAALINAATVGFLVVTLAMTELAYNERWEERLSLVTGLWLIMAPTLLGYGGALQLTHIVLGLLIAGFAALELWQDRDIKQA